MCEYCEIPVDERKLLIEMSGYDQSTGVLIDGRNTLYYQFEDGDYIDGEILNYCPMCGRKL